MVRILNGGRTRCSLTLEYMCERELNGAIVDEYKDK